MLCSGWRVLLTVSFLWISTADALLPTRRFSPRSKRWIKGHSSASVLQLSSSSVSSISLPQPVTVPKDWKGDTLPPNEDDTRSIRRINPETMLQNWFPLSFESYLNPTKPNAVRHMGRNLVIWKGKRKRENGNIKEDAWFAQEDLCPHKLAPLSDGSITDDGTALRCSLHGWQFEGCGTCSMIPALPSNATISSKCNVRSYPICQRGNLLWIWMDSSKTPPPLHDADAFPYLREAGWELSNGYQREIPYAWDYLFENILDPTHVAYAHYGVGKEFNRTEVDEIRDLHLVNLQTRFNEFGVQLKFDRRINGVMKNETWDFMYPGIWFLRRGGTSDKGPGGVILASAIDEHRTRLMTAQYNPNVDTSTTQQEQASLKAKWTRPLSALRSLKAKIMKAIFTVLFHRSLNTFFNSDAYLLRYQQEMVAAATSSSNRDANALQAYQLASPADQATVAFRRWFADRIGGRIPLAQENESLPKTFLISREDAADPWEQHSKHCPTCRTAYQIAKKVRLGSSILAGVLLDGAWRSLSTKKLSLALGTASAVFGVVAWRANVFAASFRKKGHVHE